MLAQLALPRDRLLADKIVYCFVEQLIALRDSYEHEVARLQAGLEVELAAAKRELVDPRAELNVRATLPLYRHAAALGAICPSTAGKRD